MERSAFGPIEFYLVGFAGDGPGEDFPTILTDLLENPSIRLLDLVIIRRSQDGAVEVVEIEEDPGAHGFVDVEIAAAGITGDEDIDEFASLVAPGTAAALVCIELRWAAKLAQDVAASGATVLAVERIPAPVVNALVDAVTTGE